MEKQFLGFRQVLKSTFDSIVDKKGILWFVRETSASTYGDIYLGTRHYGHFGNEAEDIATINQILADSGIVDESGNTIDITELQTQLSELEQAIENKNVDAEGDTYVSAVASGTTVVVTTNTTPLSGVSLVQEDGVYKASTEAFNEAGLATAADVATTLIADEMTIATALNTLNTQVQTFMYYGGDDID